MKKAILTVALAFALALPMAATSTVNADPNYKAKGTPTMLWQHSFARGEVRCIIREGDHVFRHWGENWDRWIYVRVLSGDERPRWENVIGCRGWIDKRDLIAIDAGGSPLDFTTRQIWQGGIWGAEVPVFRDRGAFFNARHSMNRNGHYNGQADKVACKIHYSFAPKVQFKQFKDWGVGQVKYKDCQGWMDAGVLIR